VKKKKPGAPAAKRRTQADRREGTIRKLLEATTDALIDVGYAGASVGEICKRAGVSHGGLFRHFETREALMVAAAEDVGEQILGHYRQKFGALQKTEEPLRLALRLVREACGSRLNQAWYELAIAGRTDAGLRKAIAPLAARYYQHIGQVARETMPEMAALLGPRFDVFVDTVIAIFDGEQVHRFLIHKPEVEEARIDTLVMLMQAVMGSV
jgi:AcrR family transcriptional regulator